jgi:hypothetical protein
MCDPQLRLVIYVTASGPVSATDCNNSILPYIIAHIKHYILVQARMCRDTLTYLC